MALHHLPNNAANRMVKKTLHHYFTVIDGACKETATGFSCSNGHEDEMWAAYNQFVSSVRVAHTPQAYEVYNELVDFNHDLNHCAQLVQHPSVMIKFEMSEAGQDHVSHDLHDVKFEWRKFASSTTAHKITEDMQQWVQSDQFHAYKKLSQEWEASTEGQRFKKEIMDAIKEIENDTVTTPTSIEIKNDGLDRIIDELADIDAEYAKMYLHGWGQAFEKKEKAAIQEEHFQDALNELKDYWGSENGRRMENALDDVYEEIDRNLKVTDIPNEHH